jgi:hypothetical protein
MGILRGTERLFGETLPETLEAEFRRYANLERKDAIAAIAAAIRERGDVRAAVWFLTQTAPLLTASEAHAVIAERAQPTMLPRALSAVKS